MNSFATDLRVTLNELYNLTDEATINLISVNHVMEHLDAKILQLTGNTSLKNLLEFIETKLEGNFMNVNETKIISQKFNETLLDRLKNMLEKLVTNMEDVKNSGKPSKVYSTSPDPCTYCARTNHCSVYIYD